MKWLVVVSGHEIEIDPARLEAVKEVEPGVYSILLDGKSYEVRATKSPAGLELEAQGLRSSAEVRDPRNAVRHWKAAISGGRQNITAPMPGKVIRLLVQKGDIVTTGQGVVVVEAMKMQNEMKAARSGRVADVRVRDGDTVGAGDTLVVLE